MDGSVEKAKCDEWMGGSVEKGNGDEWMGGRVENGKEMAVSGWKGVLRTEWATSESESGEGKGRRVYVSVEKRRGDERMGV